MHRFLASVLVLVAYCSFALAGPTYVFVADHLPPNFANYIKNRMLSAKWDTEKFSVLNVPGHAYCYLATVKLDKGKVPRGTLRVLTAEKDNSVDKNGGVEKPDELAIYAQPIHDLFTDQEAGAYQKAEQDFRNKVKGAGLNCEYFASVQSVVRIEKADGAPIGTYLVTAFVAYDDNSDPPSFSVETSEMNPITGVPITLNVKKFN